MEYLELKKDYVPQSYVFNNEGYALFYFLMTGISLKEHYLDPRHKWIHNAIENMKRNAWFYISTDDLISYLKEQRELENAGGESYIRKLFGNFDITRDTE